MIEIRRKNKDTVEIIETRVREIDLRGLRNRIIQIQTDINNLPSIKTKPDQETLDFWNINNNSNQIKEGLEQEKIDLERQLKEFEETK